MKYKSALFAACLSFVLIIVLLVSNGAIARPYSSVEEGAWGIVKINFTWETAAAETSYSDTTVFPYTGKIIKTYIVPDGTNVPDNNYDVRLLNEDSIDVLDGYGIDNDNATVTVLSNVGTVVNDTLSISVTNAGTSTSGVVYVYLERY